MTNPAGVITGYFRDASFVDHGYVRAPDGTFTTFDPPSAVRTVPAGITAAGAISGGYRDTSNVRHGFLRAPDGTLTAFDAPGAGTGPFQGTVGGTINPAGAIPGEYLDASNVWHGFLRAPDGTFTVFDAPGAAAAVVSCGLASFGFGPATIPSSNNPRGEITGFYFDASGVIHGFLRTPERRGEDGDSDAVDE